MKIIGYLVVYYLTETQGNYKGQNQKLFDYFYIKIINKK